MTGFSTIRKIKCPLGLCVILSFVLIYGCDILCDLGVISFNLPEAAVVSTSSHHHEVGDDHSRIGNHGHKTLDDGVKHDHNPKQSKDGCCDDLTQRFYSTLVNAPSNAIGALLHAEALKFIGVFVLIESNQPYTACHFLASRSFDHKPKGPPGYITRYYQIFLCTYII